MNGAEQGVQVESRNSMSRQWLRIQIAPENPTAILAYRFNRRGYRTYW
jgi:hypothetical protein